MATEAEWKTWMDSIEGQRAIESMLLLDQEEDRPIVEKKKKPVVPKTVSAELQDLCDIYDEGDGVTWDLYRLDQRDQLNLKVHLALFPEAVRVKKNSTEVTCNLYQMQYTI